MGEKGEGFSGMCITTHGQHQRGVGSRVGGGGSSGGVSGGGKMETTVLEQQ